MDTIENYISILPTKTKKSTLETLTNSLVARRKLLSRVLLGIATGLLGKKILGPKTHKQPMFISASSEGVGVSCTNISTQHIRMFSKDKLNPECFQVCLHGNALVGSTDSKYTVCKTQFPRSYKYLSKSIKI
jgi:hypothetical protein